jgi:uncharacterized membrane protein YuzA (DUF378 family)
VAFRLIRIGMKPFNLLTRMIAILGALNWGMMGLFRVDLVAEAFDGPQSSLSRIVYILIGLAGLHQLALLAGLFAPADADLDAPAPAPKPMPDRPTLYERTKTSEREPRP